MAALYNNSEFSGGILALTFEDDFIVMPVLGHSVSKFIRGDKSVMIDS